MGNSLAVLLVEDEVPLAETIRAGLVTEGFGIPDLSEPRVDDTVRAAADRLRGRFTSDSQIVLVLCGGNVAIDDLCSYAS